MRLIFLGPPGSGKGTQARLVGEKLGLPQISTGDILREAIARKTELGKKARSIMDAGELVPDDVVLPLAEKRIEEKDCRNGFILDGFPRTLAQALGLEEVLQRQGCALDAVMFIEVDEAVVLERLSRRRVCPKCKAMYNLDTDPPGKDGVCDRCQVALELRTDDKPETVKARLVVYRKNTLPLVEYYESRGLLRRIAGEGDITAVFEAILGELSEVRSN
ncbi:MAG: adenylate kinase [bacterium]|jgi:adenylate kinase